MKYPDPNRPAKLEAFDRLLTIMDELRAECPWDKLFGSFHDGTPEANEMVKERRRNRLLLPATSSSTRTS